jgi:NAD(P)-dependent dehydrogenase (short-subunit alcohol dehydrogenase family)
MQILEGRVAVVTGAGSGIGRALAERFAAEKMRLVLADVEAEPLKEVVEALRGNGAEVEDAVLDVREAAEIDALAERCAARFGGAHLLCNNAGVAAGGPIWEVTEEDWDWVIGVNLVGVINGIRAFVPRMIAAGEEAHVLNTASIAGLTCPAFMGPYNATKHAVVALSETLLGELGASGAPIGVSVLCPGWVQTRIHESDRNKPGGPDDGESSLAEMRELVGKLIADGMSTGELTDHVLDAIRANRFWIRTHADMEPAVAARCQAIIAGETPASLLPTDIS